MCVCKLNCREDFCRHFFPAANSFQATHQAEEEEEEEKSISLTLRTLKGGKDGRNPIIDLTVGVI